jgi:cell division septation protein DedD
MAFGDRRGATKVAPKVPPRRRPRSCVWWFLFGAMLGAFGVGLYWTMESPKNPPPPVAAIPKPDRPAPPRPSFHFPDILKDAEVEIGNDKPLPPPQPRPEPPPKPPEAPPPAPQAQGTEPGAAQTQPGKPETKPEAKTQEKPATAGSYVLQIASFKNVSDAEQLKAKLAMLGVASHVRKATIKDGAVWHRVIAGPYKSKEAMESARAKLKQHGKNAMPIKVQ